MNLALPEWSHISRPAISQLMGDGKPVSPLVICSWLQALIALESEYLFL